ncbi:MAG: carboxylating nicotinate-nucleotide diphosphorylase [Candidatus Diapherotrites archaeon]
MLSLEQRKKILSSLKEDISTGDVTTALVPKQKCKAVIYAKSSGVLAGLEEAVYLFKSRKIKVKSFSKDGSKIIKGKKIISLEGFNKDILECERTALNFLGRMSGVATLAVKAKSVSKVMVAATRKTIPLFNEFDKKACEIAGIFPHRKNLNSAVLLKENHLVFFSSPFEAVVKAKEKYENKKIKEKSKLNKAGIKKLKIEVEVTDLNEALNALGAEPDIIMLDNFSLSNAGKAINQMRRISPKTKIELSGGINLKNLRNYSLLMPDFISLGEITKNARQVDYSLKILGMKK